MTCRVVFVTGVTISLERERERERKIGDKVNVRAVGKNHFILSRCLQIIRKSWILKLGLNCTKKMKTI